MLDLIHTTPYDRRPHTDTEPVSLLPQDLEQRLLTARPRLLRIIRTLGIPADAADDLAQETLLAAWRRLDQLRSPERFDAWLDAICRNQCRMYLRANSPVALRQGGPVLVSLDTPDRDGDGAAERAENLPDPQAVDPMELVDRHDLATFLDRALGYLSPNARAVLELRYLMELNEHEAASSLGLTVNVLEARLHRARRQLRDVLGGPLRAEAETYGLVLDGVMPEGWQETRIWCNLCGRRRLLGIFDRMPDGKINLRLRCPDCSRRFGHLDNYASKGIVDLTGMSSFRPALTRTMRVLAEQTHRALETGWDVCSHCGRPTPRRVVGPDEIPTTLPSALQQHWVVAACQHEGCSGLGAYTAVEPAIWLHPAAQRFMAEHPRWITLSETVENFANQPAIRFRLADVASDARLTAYTDVRTLRILAIFPERAAQAG